MTSMGRFSKFSYLLSAAAIGGFFLATRFILGVQAPQVGFNIAGSEPYLMHAATDKPIYRIGEKIYVRGVLLRADSHSPTASAGIAQFQIKGPRGDVVTSASAPIMDSVVGFTWDIPESQAGGEYTVAIRHPFGDAAAERKFDIRAYRAPRLKSQIAFVRDGYGPGDTVAANLHVERAEGGVPAGAVVSVIARVDGAEAWKGETRVDASGNANARFKLPSEIARGEGVLAMVIQDGGIVETASKTIPILLQTIDLAIYPEGGDLIAGLPNRVYLEGRTPAQKPADMAGIVVNTAGKEVATFRTEHEGRGRFSFVPIRGESYSLRVSEPSGIKTVFRLPEVKATGAVLSSISDVTPRGEDVLLRIAATAEGTYGIALTQRGKEISFKSVALRAGLPAELRFTVPRALDGVIVATVYNDRKIPIAERLLFRHPEDNVKVNISADRQEYSPGDKVTLRVATTDNTGKPLGAMVGLTVTDSTVLEMVEKRDQAPRLPVMVLFENDVRNLSDAHVYLDETNPKASLATDLLLGTQGWRRFATLEVTKFIAAHGDVARRVLPTRTMTDMGLLRGFAGGPIGRPTGGMGVLTGVITDTSGALIPGVTVTAANLGTGVIHTTVTNESGAYVFPSVVPGEYRIQALLPGFQTGIVLGLQLPAGSFLRQDIQLSVASMTTMVEVSTDARGTLLQSSASVGQVLPQERIRNLPLVGNNVLDLLNILPGIRNQTVINPDRVGEVRLILPPVDAELGRGNAQVQWTTRQNSSSFVTVREYAHDVQPNRTEGSRRDFSETVYWNAGIKTDASTGIGTVSFNLSDSLTSFRVLADAFSKDGALGSGISHVESVQPFSLEPKIPLHVTSGDVIHLPIGIVNGVGRELRGAEIHAKGDRGLKLAKLDDNSFVLGAKERTRRLLQIDIDSKFKGTADLTISGKAGRYNDTVNRGILVQPKGFPHESAKSGLLERNGSSSVEITLPDTIVPGSVSLRAAVYPTPLASMTDALRALIREPYGCFEQTSSTSYPMVMAQQYFLTHKGVDPALIERTRRLLDIAYTRLRGFETRSGGYEWFGAAPGNEPLTAYGLMQFTDMSQVRDVDKEMLDRTRRWLLSRRDGNGRFNQNANASHSFAGADPDTVNAYIVWALMESGHKDLAKEIAYVKRLATGSKDSYIVALAANILHETGDAAGARDLMGRLADNQESDGRVKGAVTSVTRSGGNGLAIETTALSVLAWMRQPLYAAHAHRGMKWIVEMNKDGRFGSTQSTILALRSINAYDAKNGRPTASGRMILEVDGKTVGAPLYFTPTTQDALVLPELENELGPGKHTIALRMEDGSSMPFAISVKYHSTLPETAEQSQIRIQVVLRDSQIREGGVTEATVSIANKSDRAIPTPVAIVGIPGGLEVRHEQLKELVRSGRIDAYEVTGGEVVLYWRSLKGEAEFDVPLSLVAAVPGTYTGSASRAYLYYTDEHKHWAPGLKVSITPQ